MAINKAERERIIEEGKKSFNGKNFRLVNRIAEYTDERGFPRRDAFIALEFESHDGKTCFISIDFI